MQEERSMKCLFFPVLNTQLSYNLLPTHVHLKCDMFPRQLDCVTKSPQDSQKSSISVKPHKSWMEADNTALAGQKNGAYTLVWLSRTCRTYIALPKVTLHICYLYLVVSAVSFTKYRQHKIRQWTPNTSSHLGAKC